MFDRGLVPGGKSRVGYEPMDRGEKGALRNHASRHHGRSQARAFPELSAVREDKLRDAAQAINAKSNDVKGRKPQKSGPISNCQILWHLFCAPINALLVAAPAGIAASEAGISPGYVFAACFVGLVPLAKLLGDATEHLAENLNQTIGGLLNATFGNAVEMIITVSAIREGLLEIVKKSLLGSILSNLLLVLGMAFFFGGLTRSEQRFPGAAALINITMLLVGIMSFSLPTVFSMSAPRHAILDISRVSAVFVAIGYVAYLVFQLYSHVELFKDEEEEGDVEDAKEPKEHAVEYVDVRGDRASFQLTETGAVDYSVNGRPKLHDIVALYSVGRSIYLEGTGSASSRPFQKSTLPAGQEVVIQRVMALWKRRVEEADGEEEEEAVLSVPWALALLLASTVIVAVLSEYMVASIDGLVKEFRVPEAFVGVILLPIVGNACEHASAVRMAANNKVATAIAIAVGSSTQIALFVMPFSVLTGWAYGQPLDLNLHPTGLAVLFLSVIVVFSIVMDGKSNWLEGFMLVLAYCLVAVLYWFTPNSLASQEPLPS